MKEFIAHLLAAAVLSVGMAAAQEANPAAAGATPSKDAIVKADHQIVRALEKGDHDAADKFLDADFSWIDNEGVMRVKDDAWRAGLKPLLGAGSDVELLEHKYGKVVWLQASQGKNYTAHFWVERPAGWRLLHISEITVRQRDFTPVRPNFDVPCVNPCKSLPYVPISESEKEAVAAWQEQESGPAGWDKHIATNYDQRAVNTWVGRRPATKDIIAARNKHMAENPNEPKVSTMPVLWMRTWDFGDAVVMIACQPTWGDKAYWASRVFAKINGLWQMAESYQNVIQASPILAAVPTANK
jgi:hypothetical protein